MTWRFEPAADGDARPTTRGLTRHGESKPGTAGPRQTGNRQATRGGRALLGCAAVVMLASGPGEAAPGAMTTPSSFGDAFRAHAGAVIHAQASVATFEVSEIAGPPGVEIPVRVRIPEETVSPVHILLVRGLPEGFAVSKAVQVDEAWAISPQQLSGFSLVAPADYQGSFNAQFVLVWGPERTRDIRSVPVSIGTEAAVGQERIAPGATQSSAAAKPSAPDDKTDAKTLQISPEDEKAMLERAIGILQNGDIAAARLIFERLAMRGSARGALAMAKTYDPEVLTGMNVFGLVPEPDKAAKWYARAAEMGDAQARERLATLNARAGR